MDPLSFDVFDVFDVTVTVIFLLDTSWKFKYGPICLLPKKIDMRDKSTMHQKEYDRLEALILLFLLNRMVGYRYLYILKDKDE